MTIHASNFLLYLGHYFIARTLYTSLGHSAPTIALIIAAALAVAWLLRRRRGRRWR